MNIPIGTKTVTIKDSTGKIIESFVPASFGMETHNDRSKHLVIQKASQEQIDRLNAANKR